MRWSVISTLVVGFTAELRTQQVGPPSETTEGRARPMSPLVIDGASTAPGAPPLVITTPPDAPLGLTLECSICVNGSGDAPPQPANAPWSTGLGARFSIVGAQVGVSLLGSRNYRLPRFMAQPLGISGDTTPPGATSYSELSSARTEWTVSARVQRTLKTLGGGQTLGVTADAWLPLNTAIDPQRQQSDVPGLPRTDVPLLPSKALRVGLTFRF